MNLSNTSIITLTLDPGFLFFTFQGAKPKERKWKNMIAIGGQGAMDQP